MNCHNYRRKCGTKRTPWLYWPAYLIRSVRLNASFLQASCPPATCAYRLLWVNTGCRLSSDDSQVGRIFRQRRDGGGELPGSARNGHKENVGSKRTSLNGSGFCTLSGIERKHRQLVYPFVDVCRVTTVQTIVHFYYSADFGEEFEYCRGTNREF